MFGYVDAYHPMSTGPLDIPRSQPALDTGFGSLCPSSYTQSLPDQLLYDNSLSFVPSNNLSIPSPSLLDEQWPPLCETKSAVDITFKLPYVPEYSQAPSPSLGVPAPKPSPEPKT